MNDIWLRRLGWAAALVALVMLTVSAVMLFLAPNPARPNWLSVQASSIFASGAPVVGLLIVTKQPRNRIGWLLITYGLLIGLRAFGHGVYYLHDAQPAGYSAPEYFSLWLTEPANLIVLVCVILLMLWFPDGQLPSRRWRFLYIWLLLAITVLFMGLFAPGTDWNGGAAAGGIVIDNPYGWLSMGPTHPIYLLGFPSFLSLVLITILAAASLGIRYRAAGQVVRLQLRWFVIGGISSVILLFLAVALQWLPDQKGGGFGFLLTLLSQANVVPLYLAVGMAILRYRLYDIDVIVRKTLVYTALTALLAVIYFAGVVLLQRLFGALTGAAQSPLAVVVSTLAIAALFTPLRRRIQDLIDRRFFRKKYDAQQVLAQFALTARDETDLDALTGELARVVQETMQPEGVNIWLRRNPQCHPESVTFC